MEEDAGSSATDETGTISRSPESRPRAGPVTRTALVFPLAAFLAALPLSCAPAERGDTLARVRQSHRLTYGSDQEGGGPYIFPAPEKPSEVTGFEVDLMRDLAGSIGCEPVFAQGQWDRLLQNLDAGHVDLVINGYEWTESRARRYLHSRPYYVFQLQLMAPRSGPVRSWDDLKAAAPSGKRWRVGVLVASAADTFADEPGGPNVEVVRFDGATDAMTAASNGQIDATLQDLPAALFYRDRFPSLQFAGEPVGRGHYVIYFRRGDTALRDAVDRSLTSLIDSGELRRLYERYGLWNEAQADLGGLTAASFVVSGATGELGWGVVRRYGPVMLEAAGVTVALSVTAMPLAMVIGLAVALGRLYGPPTLRTALAAYVEVLRGTPLMLQLYVLYYVVNLSAWQAGILGLAINYSAYEAEIYRAGLQAIPAGQMEAALALGMSRGLALRRVIVPQAVRLAIPPVTNDFIAMFKDTSVCSVITLVELTKRYSILANSTGAVAELALMAAVLYMAMSVPLSCFSRWSERRLSAASAKGGALA
jgi:polar amino acid transport system substrate-binding protein